jgi:hypothetical protein
MNDDNDDLRIELGDLASFSCPDCGRDSATVHGYLYDINGETSVYFAGFTHGHPERRANMLVSLGGWGEGKTAEDRIAIPLQVWFANGDVKFTLSPAEESPWYGEAFLGRMLEPAEITPAYHAIAVRLAGAAIEKDSRVAAYRALG